MTCGHCFDRKELRDRHVSHDCGNQKDKRGILGPSPIEEPPQRLYTARVQTGPDKFKCRYCSDSYTRRGVGSHEDRMHFQGVKAPERYNAKDKGGPKSSPNYRVDCAGHDTLPQEAPDSKRYRIRAKTGMKYKPRDRKDGTTKASAKANAKNKDASRAKDNLSSNYGTEYRTETLDIQGVATLIRYSYRAGTRRRAYICDEPDCGKRLFNKKDLHRHIRKHRGLFRCAGCHHVSVNKEEQRNHLKVCLWKQCRSCSERHLKAESDNHS